MSDEIHVDNVTTSAEPNLYNTTKWALKAFDERGWKYDLIPHSDEKPHDKVILSFRADHMPGIRVFVYFNSDTRRAAIFIYDLIKLPGAQPADKYQLLHKLHDNFVFGRWTFDENDGTLQLEWYTHMTEDIQSGHAIAVGVSRLANLADESHPVLMQTCAELGLFK